MNQQRSVKSQQLEKRSPERQHEDSTNKINKNIIKIDQKRNMVIPSLQRSPQYQFKQKSRSPKNSPKLLFLQENSTLSEQIRIKGQQKQLYIKHCKLKKIQKQQMFMNYPYCNMDAFIFNEQILKNQNGEFTASIIEDQMGIHLVQNYSQPQSHSRYLSQQNEQNSFNGLSVSIFNDGSIFQGNYHDGRFCGQCYELESNGNVFIGNFKEGVKSGEGSYFSFSNHQIYIGDWLGGLPHGEGLYVSKDKYQGGFLNGLKFGFGEQLFSNGDRYVGQYVNGVAQGYGEYYWADGSYYKGDFKQGVRHGYGIWQDEKQIYKGNYRMDKKQGLGIYKWISKQIYKGQFRDDYRQGYGQLYNIGKEQKQKLIYQGCWIKGKKYSQGEVDTSRVKSLYKFLDQNYKLNEDIQKISKKKKRVGHKNCIPNSTLINGKQHMHN